MRTVFGLLLAFALTTACGDSGGGSTGSTSSGTSTSTSTSGSTNASITGAPVVDCQAKNACLLYPDECPSPCSCDDAKFADGACVTAEGGEYLARCRQGIGESARCEYECLDAFADPACAMPTENCGVGGQCGAKGAKAYCKQCACPAEWGSVVEGPRCVDGVLIERVDPWDMEGPCNFIAVCPFGCEKYGSVDRCK